jgi:uncharacterized protein YceK
MGKANVINVKRLGNEKLAKEQHFMKGEYQLGSAVGLQEQHKIVKSSNSLIFRHFVRMNIFLSGCSVIFLHTTNKKGKNKSCYKTPNLVVLKQVYLSRTVPYVKLE